MAKSDPIRKQIEAQLRIGDEAFAALNDADDALAAVEERQRRRATRRAPSNSIMGRVEAARAKN